MGEINNIHRTSQAVAIFVKGTRELGESQLLSSDRKDIWRQRCGCHGPAAFSERLFIHVVGLPKPVFHLECLCSVLLVLVFDCLFWCFQSQCSFWLLVVLCCSLLLSDMRFALSGFS